MNRSKHLIALGLFIPVLAFAADAGPKEVVAAAAAKLGQQSSYSWKTTTVVPESMPFKPGPIEGKAEKDGYIHVTMSFGENVTEIVRKGDKSALTDMDGNWKLSSEMEDAEGPGRFMARMARDLKPPGVQIAELLGAVGELKQEGDAFVGAMTPEGVKKQFRFGEPKNPKGAVRVWLKDGLIAKLETKVEAKMEFNGNEFDASRTATTEIKDVGTTKLNVPEGAKKKLGG